MTFKLPGGPDERPVVSYSGRPVLVTREPTGWVAIVGIPLDTEPGEYQVSVQQPGANQRQIAFKVAAKQYAVQQLKVPPSQVNLSAEDEARVTRETEKVRAALDGIHAGCSAHTSTERSRCLAGAPAHSVCAACSMAKRASRTVAWTSPRRRARRSRRRSRVAWWTWAVTSSMATT